MSTPATSRVWGLSESGARRHGRRRAAARLVRGRPRGRAQSAGVRSCVLRAGDRQVLRPPVRLTARGRLTVATVLAMLAVLVVAAAAVVAVKLVGAAVPDEPVRTKQVQVLPGQTLWEIAQTASPDADVRATVDQIVELNGLSGGADLQVGDQLRVPVANE